MRQAQMTTVSFRREWVWGLETLLVLRVLESLTTVLSDFARMRRFGMTALLALAAIAGLMLGAYAPPSQAGQERYDYDALGRLVRVIDDQGRVTEYVYDAVGNILRVVRGAAGSAQAPVVTGVTPNFLRRGESRQITVSGSNLAAVAVTTPDAGLDVSALTGTPTSLRFTLTAADSMPTGSQNLTLTNAAGNASVVVNVGPKLPTLAVIPAPLAIPPDNSTRPFIIRLSNADTIDHTIALTSSAATRATVSPASVTIPAGQLEVRANLVGISGGQATLTLASTTLATVVVPVFITAEFFGISTSYAAPVGVVLQAAPVTNSGTVATFAPSVGIAVGDTFVQSLAPRGFAAGVSTPVTLTGIGLGGAQTFSIEPASGVSVTNYQAAPDGRSATATVTVAAGTALSERRAVLGSANGAIAWLNPAEQVVMIGQGAPDLDSIEPIFGATGQTVGVTLRGRNFLGLRAVSLSPTNGIVVDSAPSVNASGTVITTRFAVNANAAPGARVVTVSTLAGSTSAVAAPANTFTVPNDVGATLGPFYAPLVGIVVGTPPAPPVTASSLHSPAVGITVGAVASARSPGSGIVGTTVALTVQGAQLQSLTAVEVIPSTGITAGAPVVAGDGLSAVIPLTIDLGAEKTLRRLRLIAGTAEIPFARAEDSQFFITAPQPQVTAVEPLQFVQGTPATAVRVQGINLTGATALRFVPPDGIATTAPVVNSNGTEITASASVSAGAPLGQRTIIVETPAGGSSSGSSPANTVTVSGSAGAVVPNVMAPLVGVQVGPVAPPPTTPLSSFVFAPLVGVRVETTPVSVSNGLHSAPVGVRVGAVLSTLAPAEAAQGDSGTLTIEGVGLSSVTSVATLPNSGITLGTPTVNVAGTQLTASFSVANNAPATAYRIVVSEGGTSVPALDGAAMLLRVGEGVPLLSSIDPILARRGELVTLTVRGTGFAGATAVTATPSDGLLFDADTPPVVNPTGTELTVRLFVTTDALLGGRVIRVHKPGIASEANAVPANTLNILIQ